MCTSTESLRRTHQGLSKQDRRHTFISLKETDNTQEGKVMGVFCRVLETVIKGHDRRRLLLSGCWGKTCGEDDIFN